VKPWAVLLILAVAIVLQTTVLNFFSFASAHPDLILTLTIIVALLYGSRAGISVGLLGGLAIDVLTGRYIGLFALTRALTGAAVGYAERRVYKENLVAPLVAGFGGGVLAETLYFIGYRLLGGNAFFGPSLVRIILPAGVLSSLLTPFLYRQVINLGIVGKLMANSNTQI